jgi:hypothetical protein
MLNVNAVSNSGSLGMADDSDILKFPDLTNDTHQFEALFNYAAIGIVMTNHSGVIINFNK